MDGISRRTDRHARWDTKTAASYLSNVLDELDAIKSRYVEIVQESGVRNIDPNRGSPSGDIVFVGAQIWGWETPSVEQDARRHALLREFRDWEIELVECNDE